MRTKVSLIVQEDAMIPQVETPVLELDVARRERAVSLIPRTVRFLRCGCPSVQWLITSSEFFLGDGRSLPSQLETQVLDAVQDALSELQIHSENFKIVAPTMWHLGKVITITRTIALKTIETTFGNLVQNDEALTADGLRHLVTNATALSDSGALGQRKLVMVSLEGPDSGEIRCPLDHYELRKIIK